MILRKAERGEGRAGRPADLDREGPADARAAITNQQVQGKVQTLARRGHAGKGGVQTVCGLTLPSSPPIGYSAENALI